MSGGKGTFDGRVQHLLSSYKAMSFPSCQWPAIEAASLEMPSMLQPSPRMQYLRTHKTNVRYKTDSLLFSMQGADM